MPWTMTTAAVSRHSSSSHATCGRKWALLLSAALQLGSAVRIPHSALRLCGRGSLGKARGLGVGWWAHCQTSEQLRRSNWGKGTAGDACGICRTSQHPPEADGEQGLQDSQSRGAPPCQAAVLWEGILPLPCNTAGLAPATATCPHAPITSNSPRMHLLPTTARQDIEPAPAQPRSLLRGPLSLLSLLSM